MKYIIKKTTNKGLGLFAAKNIKANDIILRVDLSRQKSYSLKELAIQSNNEHSDYIGHGRYVISNHPYSYINHSCDPNVLVFHESIPKKKYIAIHDIKKGDELTCDYGVCALDQFGKTLWIMDCNCKSKNCRKKIDGDYFKQTIENQKKYYFSLPSSIKQKYKAYFTDLFRK